MVEGFQYFELRDRLAGEVHAGLIPATHEGMVQGLAQRAGLGAYDAACVAERFLNDLARGLERRNRPR